MTVIFSMCVLGFGLLVTPAWAADAKAEIDFVTRASIGHLFAIEESQLAISRADDPNIRAFAQQLVEDHQKAAAALESAADGSGAAVATALDADHQARVATLQSKSGADFDKA